MGRLLLFLFSQYWQYSRQTLGIVVFTFVTLLYGTIFSLSFKFIIDDIIAHRDSRLLAIVLAGLAVGFVIHTLCEWFKDRWMIQAGIDMQNDLRLFMFSHIQQLSQAFYRKVNRGSLTSRFTSDLSAVSSAFSSLQPTLAALLGLLLYTGLSATLLHWNLTLIALVGIAVAFIVPPLIHRRTAKANDELKSRQSILLDLIQEHISAQAIVRAYGLSAWQNHRVQTATSEIRPLAVRAHSLNKMTVFSVTATLFLVHLTIMAIGSFWVIAGKLTLGELVAFQSIFLAMSQQASRFTHNLPQFFVASASFDRIDKLLKETSGEKIASHEPALTLSQFEREIRFRDVSFAYSQERDILNDLNLTIPVQSQVAFVGPSGAGKSTLVQLLLKTYKPNQGQIEWDGTELNRISTASLIDMIGYVPQEPLLFNLSIGDNIRIGKQDAEDEELEMAASAAGIHEWIAGLPDRYDTTGGEEGRSLSAGQRQRIAIARALVRQPKVLILDEATSALDPESEADFENTVQRLAGTTTIINVTHRLKSVVHADHIFIMNEGRIIESGQHDELLVRSDAYRRIWRKQTGFSVSGDGRRAQIESDRIADIPLFEGVDMQFLESISSSLMTEYVEAGQTIVRQGEQGDKFYIIVRGQVEVLKDNPDSIEASQVAVLEDGDHFGEIALMMSVPRTASIRTLTPCTLLSMRRDLFQSILDKAGAGLREKLEQTCRERFQAG